MRIFLRFGQYSSVALAAAAADWLAFAAMVSLLDVRHLTGLLVARVLGGAVSFLGNRHWTWGNNQRISLTQQGRRFLLLYGFSYGLSVALFSLLIGAGRLPPYPAKLATDIACFVVNFLVMNAYVFHRRQGLSRLTRRPAVEPCEPQSR